jgi:hypothetical protein
MAELRYFIVERWHDREHCSVEVGDQSNRYSKEKRAAIIYRCAIRDDALTLESMTVAYVAGWRAKPEKVAPFTAPVTRNSVKARRANSVT